MFLDRSVVLGIMTVTFTSFFTIFRWLFKLSLQEALSGMGGAIILQSEWC